VCGCVYVTTLIQGYKFRLLATIYKRPHSSAHPRGAREFAPAGMYLWPYGNDVIPSDSRYRLSSIHDRHIFDSMRVAMASFFDLNVRNVQDVVSTRSTRADIICVALVT